MNWANSTRFSNITDRSKRAKPQVMLQLYLDSPPTVTERLAGLAPITAAASNLKDTKGKESPRA